MNQINRSVTSPTPKTPPLTRDRDNLPPSAWSSNHGIEHGVDVTIGLRVNGYSEASWGYDTAAQSFYAVLSNGVEETLVGGGAEVCGREMNTAVSLVEPLCSATGASPTEIVTQLGIAHPAAQLQSEATLLELMGLALNDVNVDDAFSIGRSEAIRWVLIGANRETPASRCHLSGPASPSPMTIEAERLFAWSASVSPEITLDTALFIGGVADALGFAMGTVERP